MFFDDQKANIRDKMFPCNLPVLMDSVRLGNNLPVYSRAYPEYNEIQGKLLDITGESLNLGP